jgi:hypothetical protein
VDTFNDKLYFSDWAHMGVVSVEKFGGVDVNTTTDVWTKKDTGVYPMSIRVYHQSKQLTISNSTVSCSSVHTRTYPLQCIGANIRNPCNAGNGTNGGCEQLCLITRLPFSYSTGYRCACAIGQQLDDATQTKCRRRLHCVRAHCTHVRVQHRTIL